MSCHFYTIDYISSCCQCTVIVLVQCGREEAGDGAVNTSVTWQPCWADVSTLQDYTSVAAGNTCRCQCTLLCLILCMSSGFLIACQDFRVTNLDICAEKSEVTQYQKLKAILCNKLTDCKKTQTEYLRHK